MRTDVLDILDVVHRVESPDERWIAELVDVASDYLSEGSGTIGYFFDVAEGRPARATCLVGRDVVVPLDATAAALVRLTESAPEVLRAIHRRSHTTLKEACGLADRMDLFEAFSAEMQSYGSEADAFFLNGVDPGDGRGCTISVPASRWTQLDRRVRRRWQRIAAHLASAHRLRLRLAESRGPGAPVEAVLAPGGKVEHAEGEARVGAARASLARAVQAFDRAHTRAVRSDADAVLEEWKGLVAARWTLLEQIESDGRRYLVARRNDLLLTGLEALSPRERDVVALLSAERSNKAIAYELGLAVSTVGVLLARAAKKLGARSRRELAALYAEGVRRKLGGGLGGGEPGGSSVR